MSPTSERTPLVAGSPSRRRTDHPPFSPTTSANKIRASTKQKFQTRGILHKRVVDYNGDDHFSVIFQLYGSVWGRVLPWCIVCSVYTAGMYYLRDQDIVDLTIHSPAGHGFMSILVSFLVVTRSTITYARFMEARQHLADLYRTSRELIQYACVYTQQDTGSLAKQWRRDLAFRMIISLRMAMVAVEYRSQGVNSWEALETEDHSLTPLILPSKQSVSNFNDQISFDKSAFEESMNLTEREEDELMALDQHHPRTSMEDIRKSLHRYQPADDHAYLLREISHGPRSLLDENYRAPVVWALNVREKIYELRSNKDILRKQPLHANEVMKLNTIVGDFLTAYHGLKKLLTTPFPFPLIQMTRTFLFFWIFSLPRVLIPDNDNLLEVIILMFFIVYGFLGLEYVNMELDDPFGDDPNDFPAKQMSLKTFEDIYITIYQVDGFESAAELRSRITDKIATS